MKKAMIIMLAAVIACAGISMTGCQKTVDPNKEVNLEK